MQDNDLDLSGAETPADDPFADVPPDPDLGGEGPPIVDLSEAPEEERLGGTDAPPEEPIPEGSFMEDPEEPEQEDGALVEPEDVPPPPDEEADVADPLDDPEPMPEPEPPTPVEETLAPETEPEPTVPGEDADPPAEVEPEPTPEDDPLAEDDEPPEVPADPAPPPEATPNGKSPVRSYAVLEQVEGDDPLYRLRTEVTAHNGEGAIRKAYRELYDSASGEAVTLVVVPAKMFRPRPVQGRTKSNVSIDIG